MATGKSLELAEIKKPAAEPICIAPGCGLVWSAHLKKKPNKRGYRERLKKYEGYEHRVLGQMVREKPKPTKAERRAHKRRNRG
jgi:hypothetical protein